ncbi:hypothetical protein [Spirosoma gilvum]
MAGLGRLVNNVAPILFGATLGGVMGLLSGIVQSMILKKYIPSLKGWIWSTCLGWIVFWSLNMAGAFGRGYDLKTKVLEGLVHGLLFGLILGSLQWFAIRHEGKQAIRWIVANVLIWPLCAMLADGCKVEFHLQGPVEFLIALPVSTVLSGIAIQLIIPSLRKPNGL